MSGNASAPWLGTDMASELGVWRWDLNSGRVELSERLRGIFGLGTEQRVLNVQDLLRGVHPADRDRFCAELASATAQPRPFSMQIRIGRAGGSRRAVLLRGSPGEAGDEGANEMLGICQDLSTRSPAESGISQLERRLADIIAKSPSLISIKDLHHRYQMVNHDLATLAGKSIDEVIGHTATEIFPVIGPEIDAQAAEAIATLETIHGDVELEVDGSPRTFHIVSFALTDEHDAPVEVCCIATDVTDSRHRQLEVREREQVSDLIGSAMRENRVVAVGQPVVRISDQQAVSEELLIRLALPDGGGLVQPAAFLPHAERFGLVQEIDTWMVVRALRIARTRPVQINLSAVTFADPDAREQIISLLQLRPEAAARIIFEITETAAVHHLDAACAFAVELTEMGCGLALDDFGTGFGSFTYLRRLPLRYLKIDRSFVTDLPHSSGDRRVVSSIVSIAQQFELRTIAEGVEDADTLGVLGDLGADFAQGFHLGEPALL